ncbi:hypothetical protein HK098_007646 [Nowakowskiella sp. JEL0407]|nr:hypothetical protein HK098_007646 [Nowakowskiella sp. JEL0407]
MSDFADFLSSSDDPTAEFLARERAALGDEAALFGNDFVGTTSSTTSQLPIAPSVTPAFQQSVSPLFSSPSTISNSLPLAPIIPSVPTGSDYGSQNNYVSPTMMSTSMAPNSAQKIGFVNTGYSSINSLPIVPEPEPESIRKWKEEFQNIIAERDAKSEEKHQKIIAEAKDALERFYADYNDKKSKGIAKNRDLAKEPQAASSPTGNVWTAISKQIESASAPSTNSAALKKGSTNPVKSGSVDDKKAAAPKGKDLSRFKEVLGSLKQDPNAPGNQAV